MKLIVFYGDECVECKHMEPIVMKLVKELGFSFERKEIWHHPENAKLMLEATSEQCKKIPMFYNQENGKYICGPTTEEKLKAWLKKQMK